MTILIVLMLITRSRLWPLTTASPATAQRARDGAHGHGERVVVVGGQVGREDLRQVAPFGEEDDEERGDGDPTVRRHLAFDDLFVLVPLALLDRLTHGERGSHEEHAGDHGVQHLMRQQVEQRDTDRDRNDDMQEEGTGGAEPDQGWTATRRQDQRRKHGLVRKLTDEDDGEDGEDDGEIHGDLSVSTRT